MLQNTMNDPLSLTLVSFLISRGENLGVQLDFSPGGVQLLPSKLQKYNTFPHLSSVMVLTTRRSLFKFCLVLYIFIFIFQGGSEPFQGRSAPLGPPAGSANEHDYIMVILII
mgnify:CR=1 FL=1